MTRPRQILVLSLVAALAAAIPALATSYVMVDDDALVRQAAAVVDARIVSLEPSAASVRPTTDYTVEVERLLAGWVAGTKLVVRVPGGVRADGIGLQVYGAPSFRAGERAILFLVPRRDGTFGVLHLAMGAFHRVEAEGDAAVALRALPPEGEVVLPGVEVERRRHRARDYEAFAAWVADRGRGRERPADYFVSDFAGARLPPRPPLLGVGTKYTLFQAAGFNLRWFDFDSGGSVSWRLHEDGQPAVPGGGAAELQAAMAAWNDDAGSTIDYVYAGTTTSSSGFDVYDGQNVVLPDDPNDEIAGTFACATGGVLAIGGPWFDTYVRGDFQGSTYVRILSADVVMNDGIECLATSSSCFAAYVEGVYGHELGHTLGIGHSCGDGSSPSCAGNPVLNDALMRATAHGDCRGAVLKADDAAAAAHLYDAPSTCTGPNTLNLSGQTVEDAQTFEACDTLTAGSAFEVGGTGEVTFRAGGSIVLSDGFSVAAGGRFVAEIDPSLLP